MILKVIIRDRQLFGMVAALLLIDFIILLTWQLVDPLTGQTEYLTLKVNKLIINVTFSTEFQQVRTFILRMVLLG